MLVLSAIRVLPMHQMAFLFHGPPSRLAAKLQELGSLLTQGGSMARAHKDAVGLHEAEITQLLKGEFVSLVVDEATLHLGGASRPMCLIATRRGKPIMLDLLFDCPSAKQAAAAIRKSLAKYKVDIATQVVCIVGDNANINDAIARELELPRLRCLPHALHLVIKKIVAPFKHYLTVMRTLSGVLSAVGALYRKDALRKAGVEPARLHAVPTRWNQLQAVGKYLREESGQYTRYGIFELVRQVVITDQSFTIGKQADAVSLEEEDEEEVTLEESAAATAAAGAGARAAPASSSAAAAAVDELPRPQHRIAPLKQALRQLVSTFEPEAGADGRGRKYLAPFEIALVEQIAEGMPELITAASADSRHLQPSMFTMLAALRERLEGVVAEPLGVKIIVTKAYADGMADYTKKEKKEFDRLYEAAVLQSAEGALAQFTRFVQPALDSLAFRRKFDPALQPTKWTIPPTALDDDDTFAMATQAFFGMLPGTFTVDLLLNWNKYVQAWPTIPAAEKAKPMTDFWRGLKDTYPQLAPLGMWYAEMPTSSVAAERLFAVMRSFESSQRHRLSRAHVRAELMAKFNSWIVTRLEGALCDRLLIDHRGALAGDIVGDADDSDGAAAGAGGGGEPLADMDEEDEGEEDLAQGEEEDEEMEEGVEAREEEEDVAEVEHESEAEEEVAEGVREDYYDEDDRAFMRPRIKRRLGTSR